MISISARGGRGGRLGVGVAVSGSDRRSPSSSGSVSGSASCRKRLTSPSMVEESSWALRKAVGSLFGLGAAVRRECTMNVSSVEMRMYVRMAGSHWLFRSKGRLAVFVESPRLLHLVLLLHGERLAPARRQRSARQSGKYAGGRRCSRNSRGRLLHLLARHPLVVPRNMPPSIWPHDDAVRCQRGRFVQAHRFGTVETCWAGDQLVQRGCLTWLGVRLVSDSSHLTAPERCAVGPYCIGTRTSEARALQSEFQLEQN